MKKNVSIILGSSIGISLVLWIIRGVNILYIASEILLIQLIAHFLISLILYSFFILILPKYLNPILEEKSTLYQITSYNFFFFTVSIVNSFIYYFIYQDTLYGFKHSFIIFVTTYVFQNAILALIILRNRRQKSHKHLPDSNLTEDDFVKEEPDTISIASQQSKEKLVFSSKDLLFIKSSENYSEFYLLKKDTVTREVIRLTLKSIEEQIVHHQYIARTHKSYIVNLKQAIEIKGNANETKISIEDYNVPVSRSRRNAILELFKKIHS